MQSTRSPQFILSRVFYFEQNHPQSGLYSKPKAEQYPTVLSKKEFILSYIILANNLFFEFQDNVDMKYYGFIKQAD